MISHNWSRCCPTAGHKPRDEGRRRGGAAGPRSVLEPHPQNQGADGETGPDVSRQLLQSALSNTHQVLQTGNTLTCTSWSSGGSCQRSEHEARLQTWVGSGRSAECRLQHKHLDSDEAVESGCVLPAEGCDITVQDSPLKSTDGFQSQKKLFINWTQIFYHFLELQSDELQTEVTQTLRLKSLMNRTWVVLSEKMHPAVFSPLICMKCAVQLIVSKMSVNYLCNCHLVILKF